MFCNNCGAKLPDGSTFCFICGAQLEAPANAQIASEKPLRSERKNCAPVNVPPMGTKTPVHADMERIHASNPVAPAPVKGPSPSESVFVRTQTMTEAAELSISRNSSGQWRRWDNSQRFNIDARKLLRDCGKEDRYIASCDDHNGIQYYVVSPVGSVGQVFLDDNDENLVLEWVYLTPSDRQAELPSSPEKL